MIGWPQNAYVGQKVVCIRYGVWMGNKNISFPLKVDQIYIIKKILFIEDFARWLDGVGISFHIEDCDNFENGFYHLLFKPVHTINETMDELLKLQDPLNHKELTDKFDKIKAPIREKV